ncbi:MAG: transcriptional regulator NrdR [Planctomycetota bacterium]
MFRAIWRTTGGVSGSRSGSDGEGPEVICPYCNANRDKVIDSRASEGGRVIRRRRECLACGRRFTTYERVEQTGRLVVIKRDGTRVPFNPENVMRGIESACGKRNISTEAKRAVVEAVEEELSRDFDREVSSKAIGERVMAHLRRLDPVVLLRFASEYYPGWGLEDIERQVEELSAAPPEVKDQQELF